MTKRELVVTSHHDGRDRAVVVEGPLADGRFRVAIEGRVCEVDAREVCPGTWSLVYDGNSVVVDLDQRRSANSATVVASVGASEFALRVEDALQRMLARSVTAVRAGSARGEVVRAPIAGKVVKLAVAVGDVVVPQTPVIAIEAMKMENELVCERGGTVTAIHKAVGQAVDTGDLLVEIA